MKERPILMRGHEVRAILDGRQTMLRRIVKPQPAGAWAAPGKTSCPFGQPGDRLWVRETFTELCDPDNHAFKKLYYAATDTAPELCDGDGFAVWTKAGTQASPWKPSIHMPRRASRITLEVTAVRVERLQDISEEDAKAEGAEWRAGDGFAFGWRHDGRDGYVYSLASASFVELWESINGRPKLPANKSSLRYKRIKRWLEKHPDNSWAANPWVWVVEFKRVP